MAAPESVPVDELPAPEAALEADLSLFSHSAWFASGVRDALGGDPAEPLGAGSGLVYHLLRAGGDVLACYLLTTSGFILHECTSTGDSLTVAVPAWRLARVETARRGAETTMTVEIDADRRGVRLDQDATGAAGVISPAVYVISGSGSEGDAVAAFAAELRCLLLGLWQ
jgi:hypothetical protein